MHAIPFQPFFQRLLQSTDIASQMDLAEALGIHRSAVTQAKTRNAVPAKWILPLSRRYSLSPDWLESGGAGRRPASGLRRRPDLPEEDEELLRIPKAAARLCAGGGSFEAEAVPVAEYLFPRRWLARMGSPAALVFMDVVGDSMEPGIRDGDMVLVDQSRVAISPHSVQAVALEDAIYLKRVERRGDGILLHPDNPAHSDMELAGDELNTFKIIGTVVWLCRDFRWP
ncbi:MAG: helix-turn-helix domain-containing protein [Deltaproteobacteria bacterium]|jgi:phage repressor protein C with HTH and peptisase S24 domain|nr:helix-turn-helix domain-containing protein [Deltaproteobacteria bacterium]